VAEERREDKAPGPQPEAAVQASEEKPAASAGGEPATGEQAAGKAGGAVPPELLSPPAAAASTSPGTGRALLAGLLSGLLVSAAILVWLATRPEVPPELELRLAGLESRIAAIDSRAAETAERLGQLATKEEFARLSADLAKRLTWEDLAALARTLEALRGEVQELAARVGGLDRLHGELAAIQKQVRALEASSAGLSDLEKRLPELERRLNGLAARLDEVAARTGPDPERLVALERAVQELRDLAASTAGHLAGLERQVGERARAAEDRAAGLASALEAAAGGLRELAGQVDRLETGLADLGRAVEELRQVAATRAELDEVRRRLAQMQAARERQMLLALAATELSRAVLENAPLAPALDLLDRVAMGDPELAALVERLEPAREGLPTLAELRGELARITVEPRTEASDPLRAAAENLSRLVRIRREQQPPAAVEHALEAAREVLAVGDLAKAVDILASQAQEDPRIAAWLERARLRLDAMAAVAELDRLARAALGAF